MNGLSSVSGVAAPYPVANVDTDQILPSKYLKKVDREGLSEGLFRDLRFDEWGKERPDFVLNRPGFRHATILIGGPNFGCGSARETAPWAMIDHGLRCVIAPSFADIFRINCINNGILPLQLGQVDVDALVNEAAPDAIFTADVMQQTLQTPSGRIIRFDMDKRERERLLTGLDPITASLRRLEEITSFEERGAS